MKKILGLILVLACFVTPAFAEPVSQEILDQARAQAGLFMDLKNALGLDWLDKYNAYLADPVNKPEPKWSNSVQSLINNGYLLNSFPSDFSITSFGQEVMISRTITSQPIKDILPIYLPSITINGNTVSLLVQRPAQWVAWQAGLESKISRDGKYDLDVLPGASLEFGPGSKIEFVDNDGKLVGINILTYKGQELEDRFVNITGDNMTGPLKIGGNIVWHAGNDGAGSGLDADLLEGQHGNFYRNASNLNSGIVSPARLSGTYNIDILGRAAVASTADFAFNSDLLDGKHASSFALVGHTHNYVSRAGDTMTGTLTAPEYQINDANTKIGEGSNNSVRIQTNYGYVDIGPQNTGGVHFNTDRPEFYFNKPVEATNMLKVYNTGTYLTGTEGKIAGNTVWHAGNDGSNSGLDADKLDGKHASNFIEQPIRIPAGQNLNNYTTPGMYYCPLDVDAQKIANTPVARAFSLLVEKHAGVKQTFTEYVPNDTARVWFRNYYNGTWGPWIKSSMLALKEKTVSGYWYIGFRDRVEGGRRGGSLAGGGHWQRYYYAPNCNASGAKQWYSFDELMNWGGTSSIARSIGLENLVSARVGIEANGCWESGAFVRIRERDPNTGAIRTLTSGSTSSGYISRYCTIRKGYEYNIEATLYHPAVESYDDGYRAHLWVSSYTYQYYVPQ